MNFYGYKNHLKVDQGTKLITAYMVTDAAVHDSQELETLIDKDDAGQKLYGGAAYIGQEECIESCGMQSEIHSLLSIGYVRATAKIGLANLTYNLMRCVQLKKRVYAVFLG